MSLLRDIQDGAVDDSVSLSTLLRKALLLGSRIGVKEISQWAKRELDGYDTIKNLPAYRGPFEAMVLGHAYGYGGELQHAQLPKTAFNEEWRDSHLFKISFMQGVAALESYAAARQTLHIPWEPDIVAAIPILTEGGLTKLDSSWQWVEVERSISYPVVVGVLGDIRTRLLELSAQIAEDEPAAESEKRLAGPDAERVTQTFYNTIYSGATNVAIGSQHVTQTQTLPAPHDVDGLMKYLHQQGVDEEKLDELRVALREDAGDGHDAHSSKGPGQRVRAWLGEVALTSTKVGVPVATQLITQAILHHFGL